MNCSKCNRFPIQNKKYQLCKFCMHEKTHGETFQETQAKQQQKWMNKLRDKSRPLNIPGEEVRNAYPIKKNTKPIKRQTSKEGRVKSALYELKSSIELEAVQNDSYFCCGCGISYIGLDKSHILSVSQFKHLELEPRNIQLMCRDCHMVWESKVTIDMIRLHCYWDNLAIMYEFDDQAFRKELTRLETYIKWRLEEEKPVLNARKNNLLKTLGLIKDPKIN